MSAPVIGLFSECSAETLFSIVVTLLADLVRDGRKVILVDADPGLALFGRLPGPKQPEGPGLVALMRTPELQPLLLEATAAVVDPTRPGVGSLHVLPVLSAGETPALELRTEAPLEGSRRALLLRQVLGSLPGDLVVLVGPNAHGPLGTALLAHACHGAVLMADSTAKQVLHLAWTARLADVRRGGLIPSLCVETRDYGQPVPDGAWTELWATHPSFLPPHRKGVPGPEFLLILEDRPDTGARFKDAVWALAQRAVSEGTQPSEGPFAALYQEDRAQALDLFHAQIAPRQGTRLSAIESLHAVWDSPERRWADVQQLSKFAAQKFRWAEPTPDAEPLLPIYEAVLAAAQAGELPGLEARAAIDLAGMLCHAANHRQGQGAEAGALLERAEALLLGALQLERTPKDSGRAADMLGLHARTSGKSAHYHLALRELDRLGPEVSHAVHTQWVMDVVGMFAPVYPALWRRMQDLCNMIMPLHPRYALWWGAVADTHLGRPDDALQKLHRLGQLDLEAFLLAYRDRDLRPLWERGGLGHSAAPFKPRKR